MMTRAVTQLKPIGSQSVGSAFLFAWWLFSPVASMCSAVGVLWGYP